MFFWGHKLTFPLLAHDQFTTAFSMSYMGLDTISGVFWFVPLAADNIYFLDYLRGAAHRHRHASFGD